MKTFKEYLKILNESSSLEELKNALLKIVHGKFHSYSSTKEYGEELIFQVKRGFMDKNYDYINNMIKDVCAEYGWRLTAKQLYSGEDFLIGIFVKKEEAGPGRTDPIPNWQS